MHATRRCIPVYTRMLQYYCYGGSVCRFIANIIITLLLFGRRGRYFGGVTEPGRQNGFQRFSSDRETTTAKTFFLPFNCGEQPVRGGGVLSPDGNLNDLCLCNGRSRINQQHQPNTKRVSALRVIYDRIFIIARTIQYDEFETDIIIGPRLYVSVVYAIRYD